MSDSTPIKARPTTYKGIRMRSRLEARFAENLDKARTANPQAFDPAGWQYEPMCFASEQGQYLPDFTYGMLDPDTGASHRVYVEVKPQVVDDDHWRAITERMSVIWESEPDAVLSLCEFDGQRRHWHGVCSKTATGSIQPWWVLSSHERQRTA